MFRLLDELKKLTSHVITTIRISPVKAALTAIMVLAGVIAGRYLLPRTHSYYYPIDHTMYVDLYGALPMQIPITTVDLAAAKSRDSMRGIKFCKHLAVASIIF